MRSFPLNESRLTELGFVVETHQQASVCSSALFSANRRYRYFLSRIWDERQAPCVVCMTNPSTADAFKNDPTVARMVTFARDWGYGGLIVVNVFALRSTDPQGVICSPAPIGRENFNVIRATLRAVMNRHQSDAIYVVAWGALAPRLCRATGTHAVARVLEIYRTLGLCPRALGISKEGHPRHPLYLARSSQLVEFISR